MSDLISRQAAIALAKDICVPIKDGTVYKHRCIDPDALKDMPSAQPENKELLEWQEDFQGYIKMLNLPRDDYKGIMEYINEVPSAQPERKRGKWIKKHRHHGGFRSYTGFDAIGEQHTVVVDDRTEYDDLYCSECGTRSADNFLNFCPNCGADMRGSINDKA